MNMYSFVALGTVLKRNFNKNKQPCCNGFLRCSYAQKVSAGTVCSPEKWSTLAHHILREPSQTSTPQWADLLTEAPSDQTSHTWHMTAFPPHRRLWLKTQAESCWLKIHLCLLWFMHVSLSQERKREKRRTASLVHIVCLCVGTTSMPIYVCECGWLAGGG